MSLVHKNRMEIKLGSYAVGESTALSDPMLLVQAQDFRRYLASHMIPMEADDIRKKLPASADYHISLKVDGEFDILVYADGEALTVNPGGTVRTGLALHAEAIQLLKKAGVKKGIFAGELHYIRPDGKRPRVHDVTRVARQPASTEELDGLSFAVFDIIELDGAKPEKFEQTWKQIEKLFAGGKRCKPVEAHWVKTSADVEKQFLKWIEKDQEGAVLRSEAAGRYKIKPRHNLDAVIIGFTEGTEERRGMIHDLLLALVRADGCFHVLGHVGGGFTDDMRRDFLSDLKDMVVGSDYVEVNDQVAYHMVRPECVIEISVLSLIAETTRGAPVNKMVLDFDTTEKRWKIIRRLPLVNLISPQFIRRREDKAVNSVDLRLQQISELVEIGMIDRDARRLNLASSSILRREVYTKLLKGQTMVRKLVMWQTNKERDADDFPAYVIHFTDFSPNRKTPLDRDIRVSNDREQIDKLWDELVEENISKGWLKHTGIPGDAVALSTHPETSAKVETAKTPKKRGKAKEEVAESAPVESSSSAEPEVAPPPKKKSTPRKKNS